MEFLSVHIFIDCQVGRRLGRVVRQPRAEEQNRE